MKLGGLFSGVGGFELAWTQLGHEVAWMCEWDPKARKVLEARFPGVPIYPDVRDLDPYEVEAVDVVTGGSPCQGFSIAGPRTGLEHSESQLFADYVRIVDGLSERGLKYAIWENVPGVLSIRNDDGERTFTHVVGALAGGSAPVRLDPNRKWNVGLVANGRRAVSWRVLDSRHFGVAQRRRRVFACVAFGDSADDRAGRTLLAVSKGLRRDFEESPTKRQSIAGAIGKSFDSASWWNGSSVADTLTRTSDDQRMPDKNRFQAVIDRPSGFRLAAFGQYEEDDSASTLKQRDYKDATDLVVANTKSGMGFVRRLSPTECERLQSFPDGWSEPSGSHSARYKAMGNAVTVNVARWIMSRMVW